MATGRVVRFDKNHGYGFIAPEPAGPDVFLHVNDLLISEDLLRSGLAVEFEIEDGERGSKASAVRLAESAAAAGAPQRSDGDDTLCDVRTEEEFLREVTEVLIGSVPTMTGQQIVLARQALLAYGRQRAWVEG